MAGERGEVLTVPPRDDHLVTFTGGAAVATRITSTELDRGLADILNRVAYGGGRWPDWSPWGRSSG